MRATSTSTLAARRNRPRHCCSHPRTLQGGPSMPNREQLTSRRLPGVAERQYLAHDSCWSSCRPLSLRATRPVATQRDAGGAEGRPSAHSRRIGVPSRVRPSLHREPHRTTRVICAGSPPLSATDQPKVFVFTRACASAARTSPFKFLNCRPPDPCCSERANHAGPALYHTCLR